MKEWHKNSQGYYDVYSIQSSGIYGDVRVKILVDTDRELTEDDVWKIRLHTEQIVDNLYEETIKLDPKTKIEAETERSEILALFSGLDIFVEEIPNGYSDRYYFKHKPWFIVTTKLGRIKIGWRKRVISIDWSDSTIKSYAETLFPKEEVTKGGKLIHAWGYEKAQEYINKLLQPQK